MDEIDKLLSFFARYERQSEVLEEDEGHKLIRSASKDLYSLILEERNSRWIITLSKNRVIAEKDSEIEVEIENAGEKYYSGLRYIANSVRNYKDFKRFRSFLIDEQARLSNHVERLSEDLISLFSGVRSMMKYPIIPKNLIKNVAFFKSLKCGIFGQEYENSAVLRFEYYLGIKREIIKTVEFMADKKSDLVFVVESVLGREMRTYSKPDRKLRDKLIELISIGGDLSTVERFFVK